MAALAAPRSAEEISSRYDTSIVVRRWGATLVDVVVLGALAFAVFALPEAAQTWGLAAWAVVLLLYFVLLELRFGATPGKLVARVRVVGADGRRPTLRQTFLRTLLRLLEVNPFLMGGIPAGIVVLASKKRQRLGDMAAGTFVLRREDVAYLARLREYDGQHASTGPGVPPADALVPPPHPPPLPPPSEAPSWLVPTNRSSWAIAAGYLGLFAVLFLPAPFALAAGVLGLRDIRLHPGLGGKGRALFGLVMGAIFSALFLALLVASLLRPA